MSVQFQEPHHIHSDEDERPAVSFQLGPPDNRNSLMDADNEVANITEGIQTGVKFESQRQPGVHFTEPSGVKFAEPSGVKFAEPSGVKFAEPEMGAEGGKKGLKSQELHVTISTPDSAKPQATGSIRRKYNINVDVPPVRHYCSHSDGYLPRIYRK